MTRTQYETCLDTLAAQAQRQIAESSAMLEQIETLRRTPIVDVNETRAQRVIDERDGVRSSKSGARSVLAGIGKAS